MPKANRTAGSVDERDLPLPEPGSRHWGAGREAAAGDQTWEGRNKPFEHPAAVKVGNPT